MTDYSQWLESVKMGHGGLIPLLIVFILAIEGGPLPSALCSI